LPLGVEHLDPYLIHGSWLTRVHNPNGISIGLDVFAGLVIVTDRQTDRHTDRQADRLFGL